MSFLYPENNMWGEEKKKKKRKVKLSISSTMEYYMADIQPTISLLISLRHSKFSLCGKIT